MEGTWDAIKWEYQDPTGDPLDEPRTFTISLMVSPFYEGTKYAVRWGDFRCLNRSGHLEVEPNPSSRDGDFYDRCRFDSFAEAVEAANRLILKKGGA